MIRGFALALVLLLAGCGGHSNVQVTSSGSPSTGVSTGGSVNVRGRSTVGVLIAIGILAGASYASDREYESYGMQRNRSVPELDGTRTVNEHDCTKPIVDWSANLRCK